MLETATHLARAALPDAERERRILIVSWYFPPFNTIGAVRLGKFARFLVERGHDVRVLSASDAPFPDTLPLEIARERLVLAPCPDVMAPVERAARLRRALQRGHAGAGSGAVEAAADTGEPPPAPPLLRWLSDVYVHAVGFPDRQIGWLPPAVRRGTRLLASWRPDVIYASGPPFTGFWIAHILGRRHGIPWIAEFRDRWVDDPYNENPRWRDALLTRLERRLVSGASGIVTVSRPWADFYRAKYAKPVTAVYNGFDEADFPIEEAPPAPADGRLTITYTGVIYSGRRDPSPLLKAVALLGAERSRVAIRFYGSDPALVMPLARSCGVADVVEVLPPVPYRESIRIQRASDILLLMQWDDPREQGNVPAKLFEYFGVLRPILGMGLETGVPARLIRERGAGLFSNDPPAIAAQLRRWLAEHERHGRVPGLPASAREGLSRTLQYERLMAFVGQLLEG